MKRTRTFLSACILFALIPATSTRADPEAPEIAAIVDGQKIPLADVDAAISDRLFALEQQRYELRKLALKDMITTILLTKEAQKRGTSLSQLKASFTAAEVEIPDEAVERAYKENAVALTSMNADEAKERLRIDMETGSRVRQYRERVQALESGVKVDLFLQEPRRTMEIGDSPIVGTSDAKVRVVMFSDYECPFCRAADAAVRKLPATYGGDVAVILKHLPLENHRMAMPAARAAFCAADQGRFWEFHEKVVAAPEVTEAALESAARSVGLDVEKFDDCRRAAASEDAVMRDVLYANRSGIHATPSYIVNGRVLRGPTTEDLEASIARELNAIDGATQTRSGDATADK